MGFDDLAKRMAENQGKPFDGSADPERLLAEADAIERSLAGNRIVLAGLFSIALAIVIVVLASIAQHPTFGYVVNLVAAVVLFVFGASAVRTGFKLRRLLNPR